MDRRDFLTSGAALGALPLAAHAQARPKDVLIVANEFDKIYTEAGASGMNAGTNQDSTFYFVTVPANKLELWFWMESDRLSQPIGLMLVFLMGGAPVLPWRKASGELLRTRLFWPAWAGAPLRRRRSAR